MDKFLVIDTEGSGLFDFSKPADAEGQPRVAALCMIRVDETLAVESRELHFAKPDGWEMHPEATAVNGLTTEWLLAHGRPVIEMLTGYARALDEGRVVVAYNAQHDLKQMRAELRRAGQPDRFDTTRNICVMRPLMGVCRIPLRPDNPDDKRIKMPKLAEALAHFKIPQSGGHTAGGDADAALALFRKCKQIGVCPEPAVHYAKEGTKAGKAKAARDKAPDLPLGGALEQSAALAPVAEPTLGDVLGVALGKNSDIPE